MSKIYYFQEIYLSLLIKKSVEKIFEKMKVRKRRQDSLEILRFGEEYIGRFQNVISEIERNFLEPNFKAWKFSKCRFYARNFCFEKNNISGFFNISISNIRLGMHSEIYHCTL